MEFVFVGNTSFCVISPYTAPPSGALMCSKLAFFSPFIFYLR
uniref:Uncharacterized protein n=1 Tax=Anguilla anguilla TaxID=7936 RepID=A0A0E9W2T5_ANGAN